MIKKPTYIIVDVDSTKDHINERVDFLRSYSENHKFNEAWSHYHFLKQIDNYQIFQLT